MRGTFVKGTGMLASLCLITVATAAVLFLAAVPEASVRPSTTPSGRTASVYEADTESNLVLNHGDSGASASVP